jgi:mercuric ion transport protein
MFESRVNGRGSLIGGVIAAVAASLCCVGPLVLVTLGIGGAWVSNLTLLEPYRPIFLSVGILFLFLAYRKIYRPATAKDCAPESLCAAPQVQRVYKVLFWVVVVLITLALVFPYLAPLFY